MSDKRPAKRQPVTIIVPGSGTKTDLNAFMQRFVMKNTMRYEDFASFWVEYGMPYLFAGRFDCELREAVDVSLQLSVQMLDPTYSILSRTCAVYIMYAIFETQCLYPRVKIRVTAEQFTNINTFVQEMSEKQHYDLVFVFMKLRMERAFLFVATAAQQGSSKRKKTTGTASTYISNIPRSIVSTFTDISLEKIEDLSVIHEEYQRVKCVTTNPGGATPHSSVNLAKSEFITEITKQLAHFDEWRNTGKWKQKSRKRMISGGLTTSESEGDDLSDIDSGLDQTEDSIAVKRRKIREKASSTVVNPRHSASANRYSQ